jgi:pyruvate/2-oxoglutarate dehydrogenase complex dihydrolipoamide acyltransferase (E2) component
VSTQFVMPEIGESVEEGVITRWLKAVGDTVEAGEPLVEVATDKVDTEIPAPCAGVIRELLVEENSTVAIGDPLAVIEPADGTPAQTQQPPEASPVEPASPPPPGTGAHAAPPADVDATRGDQAAGDDQARAAPAPAQQPAVPVAATTSAEAVRAAVVDEPSPAPAPAATAAPATGQPEKMTRLRQTIAKRMVESLQVAAQLTTVLEVDVSALARLRKQRKDDFFTRTKTKLSFLPFFAKAAIEALALYPMLNASVSADNTEVTYHKERHLGIAVDSLKGLMVPVIRNASELNIEGLARAIADLAERTRAGTIKPDELSGGTFTLTNTGSRGALFDTPIINQPQSGILGTGAVVDRVTPRPDGFGGHTLAVCSMVYLAITYDHRIVDGADAARFLTTIKNRLERADFAGDL